LSDPGAARDGIGGTDHVPAGVAKKRRKTVSVVLAYLAYLAYIDHVRDHSRVREAICREDSRPAKIAPRQSVRSLDFSRNFNEMDVSHPS